MMSKERPVESVGGLTSRTKTKDDLLGTQHMVFNKEPGKLSH